MKRRALMQDLGLSAIRGFAQNMAGGIVSAAARGNLNSTTLSELGANALGSTIGNAIIDTAINRAVGPLQPESLQLESMPLNVDIGDGRGTQNLRMDRPPAESRSEQFQRWAVAHGAPAIAPGEDPSSYYHTYKTLTDRYKNLWEPRIEVRANNEWGNRYFVEQWFSARETGREAPTSAIVSDLNAYWSQHAPQAQNAYGEWLNSTYTGPRQSSVGERYMHITDEQWREFRWENSKSFLKMMRATWLVGAAPAVAVASPAAAAFMGGWSIGSGIKDVWDGNPIWGGIQIVAGLLGVGGVAAEMRGAVSVKDAFWAPLGQNGKAGISGLQVADDLSKPMMVAQAARVESFSTKGVDAIGKWRFVKFDNKAPEDALELRSFDAWRPGMGGNKGKNVLYVVKEDGSLVISPRPKRGEWGHIDLAQGEPVIAAGEATHLGLFKMIDNASGHYQPFGESPRRAVLEAMARAGYKVNEGAYVEKMWSDTARALVPRPSILGSVSVPDRVGSAQEFSGFGMGFYWAGGVSSDGGSDGR